MVRALIGERIGERKDAIYQIGAYQCDPLPSSIFKGIAPVFFTAYITSSLMWYGSVSAALELFGPNRYHWDNGYFSQDIEGRVSSVNSMLLNKAWEQMPEKLVLYDYIGHNPSKAGLFVLEMQNE